MAINYRTHFAYRIDAWDAEGKNVTEHLAGVEDLQFEVDHKLVLGGRLHRKIGRLATHECGHR